MRLRWLGRRWHHALPEDAPLVRAVDKADVAPRRVAVVAGESVRRLVAAVVPVGDVRRYLTLAEMWRGMLDSGDEPPVLVVLATAVAYLAPRTTVVLLHERGTLEALGEAYLRVVQGHPGDCDADAPVEVVLTPATGEQLVSSLRAAAPAALPVAECPPGLAGPLDPTPPEPPRGPRPNHRPTAVTPLPAPVVIAVASAKGGAGKSTTAVALAATVVRNTPGLRVCVVDLDVRDGQLGSLLGRRGPTVADLCADSAGITDDTVLAHLVRDNHLGVSALLAPTLHRDEPELLTGRIHRAVVAILRRHFDVIVLDCPVTYRDPLLSGVAFVEADRIVAVTTLARSAAPQVRGGGERGAQRSRHRPPGRQRAHQRVARGCGRSARGARRPRRHQPPAARPARRPPGPRTGISGARGVGAAATGCHARQQQRHKLADHQHVRGIAIRGGAI
jgi:Mrp family chromosome partitioning ATPase